MGTYKKRLSKKKGERFVALPYNMLNSEAFLDLHPQSVRTFIELKKRYNGFNNGEISLSYLEVSKIAKCSKNTAGRRLKELESHGFIKKTKSGMFTYRLASEYCLTCEENGNGKKTNEWKEWIKNRT